MYLALIKKELREILPTFIVAAVTYLIVLGYTTRNWFIVNSPLGELFSDHAQEIAFAGGDFRSLFLIVSVCFATILGFQQPLSEEWRGTFRLLLHRPLSRRRILGTKLFTGLAVSWMTGAIAILALAIWAATPGMQPAPFFWSMTLPTFFVLSAAPVIYLGAFLSAVRPGRWYATRLFPWGTSFLLFTVVAETLTQGYLLLPGVILLIAAALLIANIVWVIDQRDFS